MFLLIFTMQARIQGKFLSELFSPVSLQLLASIGLVLSTNFNRIYQSTSILKAVPITTNVESGNSAVWKAKSFPPSFLLWAKPMVLSFVELVITIQ